MRYHVLAVDYDGTIAEHGLVNEATLAALKRVKDSGRKLVLVTGRALGDLQRIFPELRLFDRVVAENGGVLFNPETRESRALAPAPPIELVDALKEKNVPLSVERTLLASHEPAEKMIVQVIRDLGLEYGIVFNKGSVMVLPSGINKATGLSQALSELNISLHNVVGAGDGENDHAFLSVCEFSVAVANAVESLKGHVNWVSAGPAGAGIIELAERLVETDLANTPERPEQPAILLGKTAHNQPVTIPRYGRNILLSGPSAGGKSTLALGFLERASQAGYQFCVIDPEGDYDTFDAATVVGDANQPPQIEAVLDLLKNPAQNIVVNLLAIALKDRPAFFPKLFLQITELRARVGHPHWLLIDEAHHVIPATSPVEGIVPKDFQGCFLVTVHPEEVAPAVLSTIDVVITVGPSPEERFRAFGRAVNAPVPTMRFDDLPPGEAWAWFRRENQSPLRFTIDPPATDKRRHLRKYAHGDLGPEGSFYFRGPDKRLNLRAQNLELFVQLAEGVDDETWMHHLQSGDYSRWFARAIKDNDLVKLAQAIESGRPAPAEKSRAALISAIRKRYIA